MKIFCFFGLHQWVVTEATYHSEMTERLGIPILPATRVCECCKTKQMRFEHLLGFHPYKMVYSWYPCG